MDRFEYAVAIKSAPEGGCFVTCRDLPWLVTQGGIGTMRWYRLLTRWTKCLPR